MSAVGLRDAAWEKRYELVVGLVLGIIVLYTLARLLMYLVHSDGSKARLVGLPIPVQTLPARFLELNETIGAIGSVEPSMYAAMTAKVIGRVVDVPVDLGSIVKPGTLLVSVDDSIYKAQLRFATETYGHASNQLERIERLFKDKLASVVEVELAQAAKATALQSLVSAQLALANTVIRSPTDAVVLQRVVNPGQFTRLDEVLIELGVIEPAMMVADVGEDKSGSIYLGMSATVGMDAFPGEAFSGQVVKIDAEVSSVTHTFGVYIKLSNRGLRVKPGLTGYARLASTRMALAVPSVALMNPVGDRVTTFVMGKDHKVHLREVRRGLIANGFTELLSGVREGEQVVTVGQLQLRDNDVVSENHFGPWNTANGGGQRGNALAR